MIGDIYKSIHSLKEKMFNKDDLKKIQLNSKELEEKITLFHARVIKDLWRAIVRIY